MMPSLAPLGFASRILDNPSGPSFLVAERKEERAAFTLLIYGHGDTVRGLDDLWRAGLSPWMLTVECERLYGRGTADNKGQHSVNIAALARGPGRARPARLQHKNSHRNGRGSGLCRLARALRRAEA